MLWPILFAACAQPDTETDPIAPGEANVFPTAHTFGEVPVFEQRASAFQINNAGEGPLTVYDIAFSDDTRRPHWQLAGGRSGVLEPGNGIEVEVYARPIDLTDPSVDLLVRTDDPNNPVSVVSLSAQPVGMPDIRLEPAQLNLGATNSGGFRTGQISVFNDGTAPLRIDAVSFVNPAEHFSLVVDPSGVVVDPELDDGLIEVRFEPQAVGILTNRLLIESNDPDTPAVEVVLTGQGLP